MPKVSPEERAERHRQLEDVFRYLDERGIPHIWLARQLGISQQRLWWYEVDRYAMPEWIVPRAWEVVKKPRPVFEVERPPGTTRARHRRTRTATSTRSLPDDLHGNAHTHTDYAARPPPAPT